jgi:UDP-glucose 4-epimerase
MNGMPIWRNWVKFKTNVASYLTILEASVSHNYKKKCFSSTLELFLRRTSDEIEENNATKNT